MNLQRLIERRWNRLIVTVHRSATFQTSLSIAKEMKLFNEQKQHHRALELFDKYKSDSSAPLSGMMINQALKACAKTRDLKRGIEIHRSIESKVKDDPYFTTSLIHLYMQCGQVKKAQSLFNQCTKKDLAVYGSMMKGYVTQKKPNEVISMFRQIKNPGEITTVLLFNACAQLQSEDALNLIKDVSTKVPKSFYNNSFF